MHKYEIVLYWSDAIELWIDTARELGRSVPQPKGERLTFA